MRVQRSGDAEFVARCLAHNLGQDYGTRPEVAAGSGAVQPEK